MRAIQRQETLRRSRPTRVPMPIPGEITFADFCISASCFCIVRTDSHEETAEALALAPQRILSQELNHRAFGVQRATPEEMGEILSILATSHGTVNVMAIRLDSESASCGQVDPHQHDDHQDDLDHMMWILSTIKRPFADLEVCLGKALGSTTFSAQMAMMEDYLNVDPNTLPPALHAKWDRVLTRIAEATVFGVCTPFEGQH